MVVADPTLEVESDLLRAGARFVLGCDEVGRGALAGPVAVGFAAVNASALPIPTGLRDSKMLSEPKRELLAPLARAWAAYSAVGLASADEIDELGIIACLGLAGKRALADLYRQGVDVAGSIVLLDGSDNWLNKALASPLRVTTRIKADRDCGSVAAASVIAKVHRDRLMIAANDDEPGYGWASNKGYGSAAHMRAIQTLGASPLHRKSWLKISA